MHIFILDSILVIYVSVISRNRFQNFCYSESQRSILLLYILLFIIHKLFIYTYRYILICTIKTIEKTTKSIKICSGAK